MTAAQDAINAAMRHIGVPYSWGGGGPSGPTIGIGRGANTIGFDCSGLAQYAYGQAGIKLPRVASDQQRATTRVSDPQPGDLVFYGTPAHHVGIYVGGGKMIAAPRTGERVKVQSVYTSKDGPTYGRVKNSGAGGLISRAAGTAAGSVKGAASAITGAAGDLLGAAAGGAGDVAAAAAGATLKAARPLIIESAVALLGLALVGAGVVVATRRASAA